MSWVFINFTCILFPCFWAHDSYLQKLVNIHCPVGTHAYTGIYPFLPRSKKRALMKTWDKIRLQNKDTIRAFFFTGMR